VLLGSLLLLVSQFDLALLVLLFLQKALLLKVKIVALKDCLLTGITLKLIVAVDVFYQAVDYG
jgi:hypothetical protein